MATKTYEARIERLERANRAEQVPRMPPILIGFYEGVDGREGDHVGGLLVESGRMTWLDADGHAVTASSLIYVDALRT